MTGLHAIAMAHPAGYREVLPEQVFAHLGKVRIVDVREPHEYVADHIPGAELMPLATLARGAEQWRKDEEIVLVCRSGQRSERAAQALWSLGFRHVMNMVGGMRAWAEACLPSATSQQRSLG